VRDPASSSTMFRRRGKRFVLKLFGNKSRSRRDANRRRNRERRSSSREGTSVSFFIFFFLFFFPHFFLQRSTPVRTLHSILSCNSMQSVFEIQSTRRSFDKKAQLLKDILIFAQLSLSISLKEAFWKMTNASIPQISFYCLLIFPTTP